MIEIGVAPRTFIRLRWARAAGLRLPLVVCLGTTLGVAACPESRKAARSGRAGAGGGSAITVRVVSAKGAAGARLGLALRATWTARHAALGDPAEGGRDGIFMAFPRDRALGVSVATATRAVDVVLLDVAGRVLKVGAGLRPGKVGRVRVVPNLYRHALVLPAGGAARAGIAVHGRVRFRLPEAAQPARVLLPVVLESPLGGRVKVLAELAAAPKETEMGLMYRRRLPRRGGMLFVFPRSQVLAFWMRNTRVPLDMVFLNKARVVTGVVHHAKPYDETTVGVGRIRNRFVLEVNAGFAKAHGVVAGTRALFRLPR